MAVKHHKHEQTVPSTVWTINHNLNTTPVSIDVSLNNEVMFPMEIIELDNNTVQVSFSSAQIGFARVTGNVPA